MSFFENGYALLVGVGDSDIPQSANDAVILNKILADSSLAAYNPENVSLLTKENATRSNVLNSLENLSEKVNENSTIIFFYSGHGGVYFENISDEKDLKEYFLCTHGFSSYNRHETGINSVELTRILNTLNSKRILVILDCCHAAGMHEVSVVKKNNIKSSNVEIANILSKGEGAAVLVSCDKDEFSYILRDKEYSVFTSKIVEALSGMASDDDDEFVSAIQMISYAMTEVPKVMKNQNPKLMRADNLNAKFLVCKRSDKPSGKSIENITNVIEQNTISQSSILNVQVDEVSIQNKLQQISKFLNERGNIPMALELLIGLKSAFDSDVLKREITEVSGHYYLNEQNLRQIRITPNDYVVHKANVIASINAILQTINDCL